jgi:hypothetical protein
MDPRYGVGDVDVNAHGEELAPDGDEQRISNDTMNFVRSEHYSRAAE